MKLFNALRMLLSAIIFARIKPTRTKKASVYLGDDESEPVPEDDEDSVNIIVDYPSSVFSIGDSKRMGLIDFDSPVVMLRPKPWINSPLSPLSRNIGTAT